MTHHPDAQPGTSHAPGRIGAPVTLLVDNHDSFTYNLYALLTAVNGVEPIVIANDAAVPPGGLNELLCSVTHIVISPGPGSPADPLDVGLSTALLGSGLPVLGVCLGHQLIGFVAGATVVHATEPRHGRVSAVHHDMHPLFRDMPSPFQAMRYHSLCLADIPPELDVIATADDGVIMAVAHCTRPLFGVQFHPESIATAYGEQLIRNFMSLTEVDVAGVHALPHDTTGASVSVQAAADRAQFDTAPIIECRRVDGWSDPDVVFPALYGDNHSAFWLDSAAESWLSGRFSYMGDASGPLAHEVRAAAGAGHVVVTDTSGERPVDGSIFDYLDHSLRRIGRPSIDVDFDFTLGYVGYLGYELKVDAGFMGNLQFSQADRPPDANLLFVDRMVVFDHHEHCMFVVALVDEHDVNRRWMSDITHTIANLHSASGPDVISNTGADDVPVVARFGRTAYLERIDRALIALRDGHSYEICLTNQFRCPPLSNPLDTYRQLRQTNAAAFGAYLAFTWGEVLSSSPERFLRIDPKGIVEACPVKGTVPRSGDDAAAVTALVGDEKQRAEHLMIVDLLRNDLTRSCNPMSVDVPTLLHPETLPTVHQLVSTVRGTLRTGATAVDAVRAAFPGGSMTGAPKERTMEIIAELEGAPRGVYSGAIGYFSLNGSADWSIVIRTIVNTAAASTVGAGGAITVLSDPHGEYDEVLLKARAPLDAIRCTSVSQVGR